MGEGAKRYEFVFAIFVVQFCQSSFLHFLHYRQQPRSQALNGRLKVEDARYPSQTELAMLRHLLWYDYHFFISAVNIKAHFYPSPTYLPG